MRKHAIRAFFVAPLVAPLIAIVILSLGASAFDDFPKLQIFALGVGVVIAIVSYAHAFILGFPIALLLLRRGFPSITTAAFCGAAVGAAPVSIFVVFYEVAEPLAGDPGLERLSSSAVQIAICAICGMLSGIVWWMRIDQAVFREQMDAGA